jgi:general secretion pathway protein G
MRTNPLFKNGFTLIELLVTISIIAILIGTIITSAAIVQKNGRDAKRKADLASIQNALQQAYADLNRYPNNRTGVGGENFNATLQSSTVASPASFSAGGKTYMGTIPYDPVASNAKYCYAPRTNLNDTGAAACDANSADSTDDCHFYKLYAQMENTPGSGACTVSSTETCTCNGVTYNYRITASN